jgi:hypothetical protein
MPDRERCSQAHGTRPGDSPHPGIAAGAPLGDPGLSPLDNLERQAAVPLVTGLLVGLFAALALTRQLESVLYEIKPNDPATLAAAVTILLTVGLAAAYVPARRAARVDPVVALRAE